MGDSVAIVRTVTGLASNLGMTTAAGGVSVLNCVTGPHDRSGSTMSYTDEAAYSGTFAAVPKQCPSKTGDPRTHQTREAVFLVPMRPPEG